MRLSAMALLVAPTVLGAHTDFVQNSVDPQQLDQGDGFYLAIFNDSGIADIHFTPESDLQTRPHVLGLETRSADSLFKRAHKCSGRKSGDLGTLDAANVELAVNGNARGNYPKGAWGWVHKGGETSFFCNYQANYLTYNLIIDMHTWISNRCGQDGYGDDRRTDGAGANDLSVGRTWRGGPFCDNRTHWKKMV